VRADPHVGATKIHYSPPVKAILFAALSLSIVACGGGGNGATGDDDDDTPIDAPDPVDAPPVPEGYTRLVGRSWTLPAGQTDTYKCVRVTIPTDMYITNIQAQAPTGTHHTVLSIAGANGTSGPDGEQDCNAGTLGMVMLYASGVGTAPLDFPADVGIKVSAGQQVHLNLHLFNATDNQLAGESAILVKALPTPPPILAEMIFAGTFAINLPPNPTPKDVKGGCTADANYSLFAIWPHMHQVATNQKVELTHNGVKTTLHDMPYEFEEQKYWPQSPEIQITAGDRIDVTCTYVNDTGSTITFGDGSQKEMCFSGLYRYPARNNGLFECAGF
jgi:Copper type II ascorbate-dependent monooxygenase, C-terminal domain